MGRRKEKPSMSMSIPCCMQPCFAFFFPTWMWQEQKVGACAVLLLLLLPLPRQQFMCMYLCSYIKIAVEAATTPAEPQPKAEQKQRRRGRRKYPVPVSWKGHGVGVLQSGTHRGLGYGQGGSRALCAQLVRLENTYFSMKHRHGTLSATQWRRLEGITLVRYPLNSS